MQIKTAVRYDLTPDMMAAIEGIRNPFRKFFSGPGAVWIQDSPKYSKDTFCSSLLFFLSTDTSDVLSSKL